MRNPVRVAHRDDVFCAVRDAVAVVLEREPETLTASTRFADVGADSLSLVEFADLVEADLRARTDVPVHIDDGSLAAFTTLDDAVDYLLARL